MRTRDALLTAALCFAPMLFGPTARSATTVDQDDKYSWGPNIGWINWQGDVDNGAVFTETIAWGAIYSGNAGWISIGDGSPRFGVNYSNVLANDFGLNVDAVSDPDYFILSGYAYSANMGWITFDVGEYAGADYQPRIEKATGILRGCAWSANAGWLVLDSPGTAIVRTGLIAASETPSPTESPEPTVSPVPTPGPTPGSGEWIQQAILGERELTPSERTLADKNGDGLIDIADIILMVLNNL